MTYNPKIIIADEPTGNLDKDTENEILKIFKRLAKDENKCIVIVTHSQNVCDNVDIVYDLQKKTFYIWWNKYKQNKKGTFLQSLFLIKEYN